MEKGENIFKRKGRPLGGPLHQGLNLLSPKLLKLKSLENVEFVVSPLW